MRNPVFWTQQGEPVRRPVMGGAMRCLLGNNNHAIRSQPHVSTSRHTLIPRCRSRGVIAYVRKFRRIAFVVTVEAQVPCALAGKPDIVAVPVAVAKVGHNDYIVTRPALCPAMK